MSTKIYYGRRCTIAQLPHVLEYVYKKVWKQLDSQIKDLYQYMCDTHPDLEHLARVQKCIDLLLEAAQSPYKEHHDTTYGINVWIYGKYVYLYPIGNGAIKLHNMFPKYVQQYGYWNNVDKPDKLTDRQWEARRKTWDKVIGDTDESFNKQRLYYEICDITRSQSKVRLILFRLNQKLAKAKQENT